MQMRHAIINTYDSEQAEQTNQFHGDVNTHNCRIWGTPNPRVYAEQPHCIPPITMRCGFKGSFIIGLLFFEIQCPVNGWKMVTVNAQHGGTSNTANPIKKFMIQTFGEDRIVSRRWRHPWSPRFPDLTPVDFCEG
ncbi:UNVERIFIED_CONTAM: hypothetical protein NCL1_41895 [Trichonephila clavipes]